MDIIIREICDRNIHQLKVTWGQAAGWETYTISNVIFQMQSLVSLELGSEYSRDWELPDCCDTINLPNLKTCIIHFASQYQWIEKLVKACPSLEKLSLNYRTSNVYASSRSCTILINAPNLVYLSISAPETLTVSFKEKPIMLRETKIGYTDLYQAQSDKHKLSKFYEAISNVRFLTLDISTVDALSTVFRNVTRLTFNMKLSRSLDTLLSVLEMCPVLDVLNLKFWGVDNKEQPFYRKPGNVISTSRRAFGRIKVINVEIDNWGTYCKPAKSFSRLLVVQLLRSTRDLEHIRLSVNDCDQESLRSSVMLNQEHELNLCEKLYRCQTISPCHVEFKGRFLKMSRKDGPKVTTVNGKVIHFPRSRKGFTLSLSLIKNNDFYTGL